MRTVSVSRTLFASVLCALVFSSVPAHAATTFEVTGWIPYWRSATGTADVLPHLELLTEVNPFVYSMKTDGTIVDNGKIDQEPWTSFFAAAKAKKVRVIPTIMWSNGTAIHQVLKSAKSRQGLEDRIAKLVKDKGFDGIDIDFEGKKAETRPYFSLFLKGLYARMTKKMVMCTIESRTPIGDRYYGADIPKDATIYSNDFKAINKYCDRVRIMAYDQQGIDQSLVSQAASSSQLYAPVADPRWVKKAVAVAVKDIKKSKILLGVPTYGYEYDVTAYANNEYSYDIISTFNPRYATQIAAQYGITPQRNAAGELYLTYTPLGATTTVSFSGEPRAAAFASTAASQYATTYSSHQNFRLLDWPDAQSIAGKVELAQSLGLRGVSIFKLDGGEDPGIWTALLGVKN